MSVDDKPMNRQAFERPTDMEWHRASGLASIAIRCVLRCSRRLLLKTIIAAAISGMAVDVSRSGAGGVEERPADFRRSVDWLRSEVVPNETVPFPHPARRGLPLGYGAITGRPVTPVHKKSFVYDAALGAIALAIAEDWSTAATILQALARVQRDDGSFWFAYNVENTWPEENDHDMGIVRAGATAWAGYGFAFYLEHVPATNEPRAMRARERFLAAARRAGDYLLTLRSQAEDGRRGLIQGGRGIVRLVATKTGQVEETYEDRPIQWISTEHNISSYFFLQSLSRLTGDPRYRDASHTIAAALIRELWQEDLGQFAQGFLETGSLDRAMALDCASWGALFLLAAGEPEKAARAVESAHRRYRNVDGGIAGHRPYAGTPVYDDPDVQRLLLPDAPEARWDDLTYVWSEGSLGLALASLRLNQVEQAQAIVDEMRRLDVDGGIRYGTRELPYQFSESPSIGGTAWWLIVDSAIRHGLGRLLWAR